MAAAAQWTWLVYMAGDNNLEGAGASDLEEMKQVGSTNDVHVIVQFDTEENKTTRYRVTRGMLDTLQEMPGVNCGDPKILSDFIQWGMKQYPAQHYLLDVWNHGGGWENLPADYNYDAIRAAKPKLSSDLKRLKRSLFRTTVMDIHKRPPQERAIAIDCGSHDYLDNQELRKAVSSALPAGQKLDILGCDACLMNMLEICYEMKDTTSVMVGSEETEPGAGWPYATILQKLTKTPTMAPIDLARCIAQEYGAWYKAHGNPIQDKSATQSALDISRLQPVADAVNALADALLQDIKKVTVAGAVSLARDRAQKFEMPEYVDLGDLATQLTKFLPRNKNVKAAATKVLQAVEYRTGKGFVVANTTWGFGVRNASGVSIYFPHPEDYSRDYRDLLFSQQGRWKDFLETFLTL